MSMNSEHFRKHVGVLLKAGGKDIRLKLNCYHDILEYLQIADPTSEQYFQALVPHIEELCEVLLADINLGLSTNQELVLGSISILSAVLFHTVTSCCITDTLLRPCVGICERLLLSLPTHAIQAAFLLKHISADISLYASRLTKALMKRFSEDDPPQLQCLILSAVEHLVELYPHELIYSPSNLEWFPEDWVPNLVSASLCPYETVRQHACHLLDLVVPLVLHPKSPQSEVYAYSYQWLSSGDLRKPGIVPDVLAKRIFSVYHEKWKTLLQARSADRDYRQLQSGEEEPDGEAIFAKGREVVRVWKYVLALSGSRRTSFMPPAKGAPVSREQTIVNQYWEFHRKYPQNDSVGCAALFSEPVSALASVFAADSHKPLAFAEKRLLVLFNSIRRQVFSFRDAIVRDSALRCWMYILSLLTYHFPGCWSDPQRNPFQVIVLPLLQALPDPPDTVEKLRQTEAVLSAAVAALMPLCQDTRKGPPFLPNDRWWGFETHSRLPHSLVINEVLPVVLSHLHLLLGPRAFGAKDSTNTSIDAAAAAANLKPTDETNAPTSDAANCAKAAGKDVIGNCEKNAGAAAARTTTIPTARCVATNVASAITTTSAACEAPAQNASAPTTAITAACMISSATTSARHAAAATADPKIARPAATAATAVDTGSVNEGATTPTATEPTTTGPRPTTTEYTATGSTDTRPTTNGPTATGTTATGSSTTRPTATGSTTTAAAARMTSENTPNMRGSTTAHRSHHPKASKNDELASDAVPESTAAASAVTPTTSVAAVLDLSSTAATDLTQETLAPRIALALWKDVVRHVGASAANVEPTLRERLVHTLVSFVATLAKESSQHLVVLFVSSMMAFVGSSSLVSKANFTLATPLTSNSKHDKLGFTTQRVFPATSLFLSVLQAPSSNITAAVASTATSAFDCPKPSSPHISDFDDDVMRAEILIKLLRLLHGPAGLEPKQICVLLSGVEGACSSLRVSVSLACLLWDKITAALCARADRLVDALQPMSLAKEKAMTKSVRSDAIITVKAKSVRCAVAQAMVSPFVIALGFGETTLESADPIVGTFVEQWVNICNSLCTAASAASLQSETYACLESGLGAVLDLWRAEFPFAGEVPTATLPTHPLTAALPTHPTTATQPAQTSTSIVPSRPPTTSTTAEAVIESKPKKVNASISSPTRASPSSPARTSPSRVLPSSPAASSSSLNPSCSPSRSATPSPLRKRRKHEHRASQVTSTCEQPGLHRAEDAASPESSERPRSLSASSVRKPVSAPFVWLTLRLLDGFLRAVSPRLAPATRTRRRNEHDSLLSLSLSGPTPPGCGSPAGVATATNTTVTAAAAAAAASTASATATGVPLTPPAGSDMDPAKISGGGNVSIGVKDEKPEDPVSPRGGHGGTRIGFAGTRLGVCAVGRDVCDSEPLRERSLILLRNDARALLLHAATRVIRYVSKFVSNLARLLMDDATEEEKVVPLSPKDVKRLSVGLLKLISDSFVCLENCNVSRDTFRVLCEAFTPWLDTVSADLSSLPPEWRDVAYQVTSTMEVLSKETPRAFGRAAFDSGMLAAAAELFILSFQHVSESVRNAAVGLWAKTFGVATHTLTYPQALQPVLRKTATKRRLRVPGWPEPSRLDALKSSTEVDRTRVNVVQTSQTECVLEDVGAFSFTPDEDDLPLLKRRRRNTNVAAPNAVSSKNTNVAAPNAVSSKPASPEAFSVAPSTRDRNHQEHTASDLRKAETCMHADADGIDVKSPEVPSTPVHDTMKSPTRSDTVGRSKRHDGGLTCDDAVNSKQDPEDDNDGAHHEVPTSSSSGLQAIIDMLGSGRLSQKTSYEDLSSEELSHLIHAVQTVTGLAMTEIRHRLQP